MKHLTPRPLRVLCLLLLLSAGFGVTRQSAEINLGTPGVAPQQRPTDQTGDAPDAAARARASRSYGQLPLSFEANRGQTDARVKFLARNNRYSLFLTADEAVLALRGVKGDTARGSKEDGGAAESRARSTSLEPAPAVLRMRVEGANRQARVAGLEEMSGRSNYLVGTDSRRWQKGVPNFGRVRYEGIYKGVDLVYYGNQRQLEYDFNVAAGADPRLIRLSFKGAQSLRLDEQGDLLIETPAGELRQHRPVAYQTIDGERREVACAYVLGRGGSVSFKVGAYDAGRALVIDPVLSYATYLGGDYIDEADAVAVDYQGNAYVVGTTVSMNFPVTSGAFQKSLGGTVTAMYDAFVTKLNPAGTKIIFSTFLGGSNGADYATSVAVNPSSGQVYLAGETNASNFPVQGGFQYELRGERDAFVAQLDANGSALLYSTYLGGSQNEYAPVLGLAGYSDVVVAGRTYSPDFPIIPPSFQRNFGGGNCPSGPCADGFVTYLKMTPSSSPLFSTFLGGTGDDMVEGIAVSQNGGTVYVTGRTSSTDFHTTQYAPRTTKTGGPDSYDAFVTCLDSTLYRAVFSTYLGGSGDDYGHDLALDSGGGVWVTGLTGSTDFPTTPDAFQPSLRGEGAYAFDAFLTRLPLNGDIISYSTYLGGSENDAGVAVAPVGAGAYVAGHTGSRDLPVTRDAFQPDHGGGTFDGFIANIQPPMMTGMPSLIHLSYVGGSDNDYPRGISVAQVNSLNHLYLVGSTSSQDFYTTPGVIQPTRRDSYYGDGFVARVNLSDVGQVVSGRVTNSSGAGLADVEVTLTGSVNRVVRTRDDGTYSIGGIPTGGSLTLTARRDMFVFEPSNVALDNITSPQEVNFSGDAPLVIKGRVTDTFGNGRSVPVELSGATSAVVQSDEQGYYRFAHLPAGGAYTVAPYSDPLMAYDPPSQMVASLDGDRVFNFKQLAPPKISGRVTDSRGVPRFCFVTLRNAQGTIIQERTTDYDGRYQFFPLPRGENYTVTPALPDSLYTFTPESRAFDNLQADQTADFTALMPVLISGRITNEHGYGVIATVTLSGTVSRTVQTEWDGRYSFYNLPRGGDYTVTPSIPDTFWTFTPASRSVANAQQELVTFDFAAVRPLHVSGRVTDENGNALSGVPVRLNGSVNATVYTDPSGWYGFHELQRGGSYTLAPEHEWYNFTPAVRNLDNATEDQLVDFAAALKRYRIGGRVADANGNGVANVTVELNGFQGGTTLTDAAGSYAFEGLRVAQSYSVRASRPGWSLAPEAHAVNDLRADETADFSAARLAYAIRGRVEDAQDGGPLAGVSVALSGSQSATAETDAAGNYAFTNLPSEGNYTVTATHRYYNVAPASRTFDNLLADQEVPFNATRINYQIVGRVVNSSGAALPGVTVSLGGARNATAYTDGSGNYTFADLPSGHAYTVTASAAHYSFAPPSRVFERLDAASTADFTATLLRHDITGRVVDANGVGVGGVDINLSGAQAASARTDAAGNYAFASLPAGGNYTVSAFHGWYGFAPAAHSFNDLGGNQSANFTGTLHNFRLTGQITEGVFGVAGVTVSLSGSQAATTQTDAGGYYSFSVPAGGTYAVTPSHPHFVFSPAAANFAALSIHQSANFAAARLTYQLSGYARDACNRPIAATTLTLARAGAASSTTQTDDAGFYSFAGVPAGYSYTLTPSKTNYSFNPSSASLPSLSGNRSTNFTGTPAASTAQLAPLADAYVRGGTSANTNYGTATQLVSRLASSASNTYESYLTFDVGQQCTVSNVRLRLYGRLSSGSNLAVSVYSVANTTWTETGIKWSNKPPAGPVLRTTNVVNSTAAFYEWDITDYVRGEINAGRTRISLVLRNTATTSNDATFNSRQAATNQPHLLVTTP